jgi:hypothetical protein
MMKVKLTEEQKQLRKAERQKVREVIRKSWIRRQKKRNKRK